MSEKKGKVMEIREDSVEKLLNEDTWLENGASLWRAANMGAQLNDTPLDKMCFDAQMLFSITFLCMIDLEEGPSESHLDDIIATLNANFHRMMDLLNQLMAKWKMVIKKHQEAEPGLSLLNMLSDLGKDTIH